MQPATLDNLDSNSYTDSVIPFQFREKKSEKDTHEWLMTWFAWEYERAFPRYIMYKRYLNMYKNVDEYEGDNLMRTSTRDMARGRRKPKVKDNIVYGYTEQRVARNSRKKIAMAFIPRVQNDQEDINAAEAVKLLNRSRNEELDFDGQQIRMDRTVYLLGHGLYEEGWDPDGGHVAPSYDKAEKKFGKGKVPKLGMAGAAPAFHDRPVKIGDTKGTLWQPYEFFPEPGKFKLGEDVDYLVTFSWKTIQFIEAEYGIRKGSITGSEFNKWDFNSGKTEIPNNEIMVRTFWHRPTKFYPEGCKITFVDDQILEWEDFPFEHGRLPFVDEKDIEVEKEFWGRPFVSNIEQFYKLNNSLISGMARNHGVLNAPKVMAPEGSVDSKSMNNEFGMLYYKGAVKPEILHHQYVNAGELEFQKYLQSRAGELSQVFDISRGEVPNGITAASAIRYLDEQELQRAAPSIAKRNRRVVDITELRLYHMSQFYKPTDNRTIRLVGKNNEYIIESFNKYSLDKIARPRIENTSPLGDTKSGAIADIIDLNASNQANPLFGPKEIIKVLDLGLDEAFKDETSYAVDTARTILQQILNGKEVPPPTKADGLFEFYGVFSRYVESIAYKLKLKPTIKLKVDAYIMGLEMLMWQMSVANMKFGLHLQTQEKFPMFFSPPEPPPMPDPSMAPPADGGAPAGGPMAADTSKLEFAKQNIQAELEEQQGAS